MQIYVFNKSMHTLSNHFTIRALHVKHIYIYMNNKLTIISMNLIWVTHVIFMLNFDLGFKIPAQLRRTKEQNIKKMFFFLRNKNITTLDFVLSLASSGIDNVDALSRRGLHPLPIGVVLVDIAVDDLCEDSGTRHGCREGKRWAFWGKCMVEERVMRWGWDFGWFLKRVCVYVGERWATRGDFVWWFKDCQVRNIYYYFSFVFFSVPISNF